MNKGTRRKRRWLVGITGGTVIAVGLSVGLVEALSGGPAAASSSPTTAAKSRLAQAQAAQRASASRAPKTGTALPLAQAAPGAVEWPSGILDIRQPPEPGVTQTNEWAGVVNGQDVEVHAGAVTNSTAASQGVIVVTVYNPSGTTPTLVSYYAPTLAGPFTIASASGDTLTIQGSGGGTQTFDAATDTFGS